MADKNFYRLISDRNAALKRAGEGRLPGRCVVYQINKDLFGYADPGGVLTEDGVDESACSATFVISTAVSDRDGDVVLPTGFQLENYRRNPVVFFNHQQGPHGLPIGTAEDPNTGELSVRITPEVVKATCWFDQGGEFAMEIFRLVAKRILRATSVGFTPLEVRRIPHRDKASAGSRNSPVDGYLISRLDLLEFSCVGVGSNPQALRDELDGKGYSPATRKALLPYAARPKVWAPGFGPKENQPMHTRAKLPEGQGIPMPAPDEEKPVGVDIQRLVLPKEQFQNADAARAWVEAQGYNTDGMVEDNGAWVFEQFPEGELAEGSLREEQLSDGVKAVLGQRQAGPVADETPAEDMPEEEDKMEDDVPEDEKPEEDKQDEPAPEETPEEEPAPDIIPPGAQVLTAALAQLEAACAAVRNALPMQEKPETIEILTGLDATLAELVESVRADAASAYPGQDFGEAQEVPDDGKMEEDDHGVKRWRSGRTFRAKARLSKRCKACVMEAAEYMEDMGGREDLPKSYRGGLKYHARELTGLLKEMDQPEAPEEEEESGGMKGLDAEAVLAEIASLKEQLSANQKKLFRVTG